MQEWQKQVMDDEKALTEKLVKLQAFMDGDEFRKLGPLDRSDLRLQLGAMKQYQYCLQHRIERFEQEPTPPPAS